MTEDSDPNIVSAGCNAGEKALENDTETTTFPFCLLPAEIQQQIWTLCLPRRVVELCPQAGHKNEAITNYAEPRLRLNRRRPPKPSRPPLVSSICFEGRSIWQKNGCWKVGAGGIPIWLDAQRDTILLNGEREVDYMLLAEPGFNSDKASSQEQNNRPGEDINPPKSLHEGAEGPGPLLQHQLLASLHEARGGVAVSGDLLSRYLRHSVFPVLESATLSGPLMVFFDDVCIKGSRKEAVESGLFGMFLEERMFFVPLDDFATFRRLRELDSRPGGLRIGNAGFFRSLMTSSHKAQNQKLLEEYYLSYRRIFNMANRPRIEAALADMPAFQHVVMFRYCEQTKDGQGP